MESCIIYQSPSPVGFLLGSILAVGIFISYVPQHLKVIERRTSEGLSPLFLLLGSTSGFSAFINLLLVTLPARECCHAELSKFQCLNSQLGLVQVASQALGYSLILILCVQLTATSLQEPMSEFRRLYWFYQLFIVYVVVNSLVALYLIYYSDISTALKFANFSGVISTILATAQYIPQIYTTLKLKHPGTLSIYMMCLQTPGGYIWSLSLYLQPGSKWSSWLPYFTAASLQMVLLALCVFFTWRYDVRGDEEEALERAVSENMEEAPLLNERSE